MGRGVGRRKGWRKVRMPTAPGLGERIRELREKLGLTQAELGGDAVTGAYISQIERGTTRPSLGALTHIAERLGTTAVALGVAGTTSTPNPFRAVVEAMAILRSASAAASPEEQVLIGHLVWGLEAGLSQLATIGSPAPEEEFPSR